MQIAGEMLIGRSVVRGSGKILGAVNAATGEVIDEAGFPSADTCIVDQACALASMAFDPYRSAPLATRAALLDRIADGLSELGSVLIERAHVETGLPKARLEGERARTTAQLRLFASLVREGRWHGATIDSAMPNREPLPRPDLRMQKIPVGPVAVFGASNFPLAFSVAGGDTASALAAGCPVIVKAHSAHLGTSELVGRVIQKAVAELGLPEGTFSLIMGEGAVVGEALVAHPAIKAVGFTGSRAGGTALMRIAAARLEPIPVYAEMSSINPVFLLPHALETRGAMIASGFVDALVLGAGQFCTNPGLVAAIDGDGLDSFIRQARESLQGAPAQVMLTRGIHAAYERGIERVGSQQGVTISGCGQAGDGPSRACAALFVTDAQAFLSNPLLHEEVFGPASTIVRCKDESELIAVATSLEGQLTATMQLSTDSEGDIRLAKRLLSTLEKMAGRILVNGFPTGVEVSHAMVHGGPFPATSDSRVTSVGATSIERFLRPVCYQGFPGALLPDALKDDNPLKLWRLKDGLPSPA